MKIRPSCRDLTERRVVFGRSVLGSLPCNGCFPSSLLLVSFFYLRDRISKI